MPDVVVDIVNCVRESAPLLLIVAGGAGWLVVRVTRPWGFRQTGPIRLWPRRVQRVGRRVVVPAARAPRRHRRSPLVGGIKQW